MTDGVFNASFIIHYRRLLRSNFSHGHSLMGLQKKPTCLFARGETQSNQFAKETHLGYGYLFVNSAIGGSTWVALRLHHLSPRHSHMTHHIFWPVSD